ncbi:hypothetical protein WMY93_033019 [Mugilogobius chulae]|uniref:CCHC-type domain-containing protein n=1 Tax=Mugilogobius chulae TaxID=88201 RepID=A0AAW0MJ74_9GOBI
MTYSVREYVPRPLRCFKCQRFGHLAQYCKGKRRCARCGDDHDYEECEKAKPPRCCNCGGGHSVAYGGCEVMRREVRVQQVRVQNKLSYAEAVQVVKQGQQEVRRTQMVLEPPESNSREFVKRLITFVAGVINATKEIKSKTERIQVIVKAAVSHLKIDDLRWEEVRDELEAEGDRRGGGE